MKQENFIVALGATYLVLWLVVGGTVAYVVAHFVVKYW